MISTKPPFKPNKYRPGPKPVLNPVHREDDQPNEGINKRQVFGPPAIGHAVPLSTRPWGTGGERRGRGGHRGTSQGWRGGAHANRGKGHSYAQNQRRGSSSQSRPFVSDRRTPVSAPQPAPQPAQHQHQHQRVHPSSVVNKPIVARPVPHAVIEGLTVDTTNKRPLDADPSTSTTKRRRVDREPTKTTTKPISPCIRVQVKMEDETISQQLPQETLTSQALPSIKFEPRSPSPLPTRHLVTQACAFYPLPANCRKTLLNPSIHTQPQPNPSYLENRRALVEKEKQALRAKGLKAVTVLFRDDGMVIEWTSPIPVWNDTLLPESTSTLASTFPTAPVSSSPRLTRPEEAPPSPFPLALRSSSPLLSNLPPIEPQIQPHSPSQTTKRRAPAPLPLPTPILRTKRRQSPESTSNDPHEIVEVIDIDDDSDVGAGAGAGVSDTIDIPSLPKKRHKDSTFMSPPAPAAENPATVNASAALTPAKTKRRPVPLPPLRKNRELQSQQQEKEKEKEKERWRAVVGAVDPGKSSSTDAEKEKERADGRRTEIGSLHQCKQGDNVQVQAEGIDIDQDEDEVEQAAVQFLQRYLHTFDTDFQALQSAYAEEAMFSCRVLPTSSLDLHSDSSSSSTVLALPFTSTSTSNAQHPHLHLIKANTPTLITQSLAALSAAYKFLPGDRGDDVDASDEVEEEEVKFHYDVAPLGSEVCISGGGNGGADGSGNAIGSGNGDEGRDGVLLCAHGGIVELLSTSVNGNGKRRGRGVTRGVDLVFVLRACRAENGERDPRQKAWPLVVVAQQVVIRGLSVPMVRELTGGGEEEFPWLS